MSCACADYMDDYWRMPHQPTIHWGNAPPDGFCSGFHAFSFLSYVLVLREVAVRRRPRVG